MTSALPDIQPNCIQLVSGKIAIFQADFCRLLNVFQYFAFSWSVC